MKTAFFCLVTALLGLAVGLMVNVQVLGEHFFSKPPQTSLTEVCPPTGEQSTEGDLPDSQQSALKMKEPHLLHRSYLTLHALKQEDFALLADLVHPEKGLRFTPYSSVDLEHDLCFMPKELEKAKNNTEIYTWGIQDGSGFPLDYTIGDYMEQFVFPVDYCTAPQIGINHINASGNSIENVQTAYPEADFVEFYFPAQNPAYEGIDWSALKLVFENVEGEYYLIGLIHSQWTV